MEREGTPQPRTPEKKFKLKGGHLSDQQTTPCNFGQIKNSNDEERRKQTLIGRKITQNDGVYVKGKINDVEVTFTADTGASCTIMSEKIFQKIIDKNKPVLEDCNTILGAGGQPLKTNGRAEFTIQLGNLHLKEK